METIRFYLMLGVFGFFVLVLVLLIITPPVKIYRIVEVKNNRTNETKYRIEKRYNIIVLKYSWNEVNSFSSLEEAEKEYLFLCSQLFAEEETVIKRSDKND